jgi:TolA-binding protein
MDSVTREDLKRNELGEAIEGAIHYAEDHSKLILRIAAGLGIAGVIAIAVVLWTSSRREGANELLVQALKAHDAEIVAVGAKPDDPVRPTFASESARSSRALELFTQLDSRYGGTKVGRVAKLYLAQMALDTNDKARARTLWSEFLDAEPAGPMAAAARVNLWKLDRAEGKADTVAAEITRLLATSERPLPEDALLFELALSQQAAGKKEEAAATYRRIVDEHPQSPYFAAAQREAGPPAPPKVG